MRGDVPNLARPPTILPPRHNDVSGEVEEEEEMTRRRVNVRDIVCDEESFSP